MEAIVERCCGLDVHQASVVACLVLGAPNQKPRKEVRTFGTTTGALEALRDWLKQAGCTHVGMESTGIYWRPVYEVLEDHFELIVGNAQHIKNVPGRKTDVKDSEWIGELLRHGLIKKSFVPPRPIRELRDLVRYRVKLVGSRSSERNRLLKLLETANIKLSSVATDSFGVSGLAMLKALAQGDSTPEQIATLARGRLRKKVPQLEAALRGRLGEHHRFLLGIQLARLEAIDKDIAQLDERIAAKLEPYQVQHTLLMQIPGVSWIVAASLIAELGVDMSVFLSACHLASWAGVCPGNNESAGKHKSSRSRKGNAQLRTVLVQAAIAGAQTRGSYLRDKFYRLKARRGFKRAAFAIAHKILLAAYNMLRTGRPYKELGELYLDQLSEKRVTKSLVTRLERLGYRVTLQRPDPAPAPPDVGAVPIVSAY